MPKRDTWKWDDAYIEYWHPGSLDTARGQIPGLVKLLSLEKPCTILDCPCGWGRYSNPLAELGHHVVGFDFTEEFIEMAKSQAPEENPPRYEVRDMREIDNTEEFDAILNLFGSFGYYDRETDFSILERFVRALKPGGRIMIDQYNREKLTDLPKIVRHRLPSGRLMVKEQTMDIENGIYHLIATVYDGSRTRKSELTMNWYSVDEYRELLSEAGAGEVELYGDFDGRPYSAETERQIVVAKKHSLAFG